MAATGPGSTRGDSRLLPTNRGGYRMRMSQSFRASAGGALALLVGFWSVTCQADAADDARLEENKALARNFYADLWFSNNTGNVEQYVAPTYVVHDIGERKNLTEPAVEQKNIADFFWQNGDLSGDIQYQVAEGDLVATRWTAKFTPATLVGKFLIGGGDIPIINVFRFENGKIVEIWNHRHDIDTPQTLRFTLKGLLLGLLIAILPFVWALRLRGKLKRALAT